MSHLDPDVLALRALGEQAGPSDAAAHLAGCPQCRAELAALSQVAALARTESRPAGLIAPPASTWAAITRELGPELAGHPLVDAAGAGPSPLRAAERAAEPAAPPHAAGPGRRSRLRPAARSGRRFSWPQRLVLTAVAGLLIGAVVASGVRQLAQPARPAVVGTTALRPLPQFPQWRHAAGRAVAQRTGSGTQLHVTLRAPSRPGYYEVWLLGRDGAKMISLGDLNSSRAGVFTLPPGTDLHFYSRIDISLQPFNGSPVHTPDSVVRGPLP